MKQILKVLQMKAFIRVMIVISVFMLAAIPAFAQSLNIDANMFIGQINTWLGMAIGIIGIGVGIAGAFAIATYVGRIIIDALSGRF